MSDEETKTIAIDSSAPSSDSGTETRTITIDPSAPSVDLGANDFNELNPEQAWAAEQGQAAEIEGPSIDPKKVLELGDRILIVQDGDKLSVGTVYYRTGALLRLKSDGDNTMLIDFPREYTEEEDRFEESLGIKATYILEKRTSDRFTAQQRFQANMILQGWKGGEKTGQYKITRIYEDRDAIEIENVEDSTEKRDLAFD
jgi:hypothetical protein